MVTLSNEKLTLKIKTLGAEITSLIDENGVERMWSGDPAIWSGQAPVLFPIAGGLKDNTYYYKGQKYELPNHGFARRREFAVEDSSATSATFLLAGEGTKHEGYPFLCEFRVRYTLLDNQIRVEYIVTNLDDEPMYFTCGSHEAYACPEGIGEYELIFAQEETADIYPLLGQSIARQTQPYLKNQTVLPLTYDIYRSTDTLVFANLKSRSVTLQNKNDHSRRVRVDFDGFDYLLLWTKIDAPYFCIEPWCCTPDFVDSDQDITHKQGIIRLEGKQTTSRTHTLTIL